MLVARQALVERRARGHAGLLQLDNYQRQAVDKARQIWAAALERARDAELADQQGIIVRRMLPIHHQHQLRVRQGGYEPLLAEKRNDIVTAQCAVLKIEVLDHIVVGQPDGSGNKGYLSLRELGYFWS